MATQTRGSSTPARRSAAPARRSAAPARRSAPPSSLLERWEPLFELMEGAVPGVGGDGRTWSPRVDIEETDEAWVVEAEVPGVKRDDIDVELRDSELVISGEVKERERKGILRHRTRRVGQFEYRVTLPGESDPDRIEASLKDGILTVQIPKPERTKPRRIEVKS